jgi:hypothetical protein
MRATSIAAILLVPTFQPARPDSFSGEVRFRELYKELIETNTSLSRATPIIRGSVHNEIRRR